VITYGFAGGLSEPASHTVYPTLVSSSLTRDFVDATFDTTFVLGSVNDTVLLNPIRIVVTEGFVYVFDAGDNTLKAYANTGRHIWTTGRGGGGPGEFRKVRDLSIGADGALLVLDQGNGRLSVVGADGQLRHEISLTSLDGSPEQVVQIAADSFIVYTLTPMAPLAVVDTAGGVLTTTSPSFDVLSKVPYLGTQAYLSSDPYRPQTWIYGFMFVDRWRVFDGLEPASEERRYAEEIPLPEVETEDLGRGQFSTRMKNSVRGALSISVVGDTAFVLFAGRTAERNRLVDMFRLSTGRYEGTILLPGMANDLAATRDHFVLLVREPYPHVVSLQYQLVRR
jgi:hypothetical protein